MKVDTRLSHRLPWWASDREGKNAKGKEKKLVKTQLTRQQATMNYGEGQRSNVTFRKTLRAIW